ncbi:endoglucanase V-like protein [Lactarius tabidus]
MKSALILTTVFSLLASAVRGSPSPAELGLRATDGYVQEPNGTASFTFYSGCQSPACGETTTNTTGGIGGTNGFSAAVSQLAFGSEPGLGAGNACGRCFELTGEKDPYDLSFNGPFKTIIVKATDMCPVQGNEQWCGQTTQNPVNSFGASMHFDLCQDSGAAEAFFTTGHGAFTGSYRETNCKNWAGSDSGNLLWNGACLDGEKARTWPKQGNGCPNKGTPP